jgi:phosphoserine phosphatase RsbU/P
MKILIAEDDLVSRSVLQATLERWGYEVIATSDGSEAWVALQSEDPPSLAVLDWMMPEMDGLEVCRRVRANTHNLPVYIILLTARGSREDLVSGLEAGADDYVTKPFNRDELRARLNVGVRVVQLQRSLATHVRELQLALNSVKQLQGLLPICMYCKSIRNDDNYWQRVENYISEHSDAKFSHSICPSCYEKIVKPEIDRFEKKHA